MTGQVNERKDENNSMPDWMNTLCASGGLSTQILIVAVIAYLPNLYFNSNSTVFRKKERPTDVTEKPKSQPIQFNRIGVLANYAISAMALAGIALTFYGC
jgi:hypothetical protein